MKQKILTVSTAMTRAGSYDFTACTLFSKIRCRSRLYLLVDLLIHFLLVLGQVVGWVHLGGVSIQFEKNSSLLLLLIYRGTL